MTHRTSFALDQLTARRLKRLSAQCNVSQAEVVRRSVEMAEKTAQPLKRDSLTMLRRLHENGGGLHSEQADAGIAEIREDRQNWRAI